MADPYDGCPGAFASEEAITAWQDQRAMMAQFQANGHRT